MPRDCNGLMARSVSQDDVIGRVAMLHRTSGALTVADDGEDVGVGPRLRRLVAMRLGRRRSVVSADRLSAAVFAREPTSAAHRPGVASRDLGWSAARNSRMDHPKAKSRERGTT